MKSNVKNYVLEVIQHGQKVDRVHTHSLRAFLTHLRSVNWKEGGIKAHLRVSYGKKLDRSGQKVTFSNHGCYENKEDLEMAFLAFNLES